MPVRPVEQSPPESRSGFKWLAASLRRREQLYSAYNYVQGLLRADGRRSTVSMAAKIRCQPRQLQHFVSNSPWDPEELMAGLRQQLPARENATNRLLVLSDLQILKQGQRSVGVARQPYGDRGKYKNNQTIVTWHWTEPNLQWPMAAQLYLPPVWIEDKDRLTQAKVPDDMVHRREKWQIALDLLDRLKSQVPVYRAVAFGEAYSQTLPLLGELEQRGEHYIAQISRHSDRWPFLPVEFAPPDRVEEENDRVRRERRRRLYEWLCNFEFAAGHWLPLDQKDTGGAPCYVLALNVAMVPWQTNAQLPGKKRWLIILRRDEFGFCYEWDYFISNLTPDTNVSELGRLALGFQRSRQIQAKIHDVINPGNFRGRSWPGLQRHVALSFLASTLSHTGRPHPLVP